MPTAIADDRTIWYSPLHRHWWMDPADALAAIQIVLQYPDAIHVTNAYEVLPSVFVNELRAQAER